MGKKHKNKTPSVYPLPMSPMCMVWSTWQKLCTHVQHLQLDGQIESRLAESMINDLMVFKPYAEECFEQSMVEEGWEAPHG